jgi:hypothetical protein
MEEMLMGMATWDAGGPEHVFHNFSGFVEGLAGTAGEVASPGGKPRGGGGG